MRLVSNKPLRDAFLHDSRTANELAAILGYYKTSRGRRMPDQTAVLRALGLRNNHERNGMHRQQVIGERKALVLGELLGLDPHELNL